MRRRPSTVWFSIGAAMIWPFGIVISRLSAVTRIVWKILIASTTPVYLPITTVSVTLYGRSTISITPAAKFDSEPWSARPTARPAAPSTATTAVVLTPTVSSDAITTTTNSEASILLRSITRSSARRIARDVHSPTSRMTSANSSLIPMGTRYRSAHLRTSSNVIVIRDSGALPRRRVERLREMIEEQGEPRRQVVARRIDRVDLGQPGAPLGQHADEPARGEGIGEHELREQRDAASGERDIADVAIVVAREPRVTAEFVGLVAVVERPRVHRGGRREQHVLDAIELVDRLERRLRDVRRRRGEHELQRAQPARDQRRFGHGPEPDRDVEAVVDQVDDLVGGLELDVDLGVLGEEAGDDVAEPAGREVDRRRDPQPAARGRLHVGDELLGLAHVVDDALAALVVHLADIRQRELAGRALDQPDAEARFELGQLPADRRFRQAEGVRRTGKALGFGDLREDDDVVEVHDRYARFKCPDTTS